MLTTLIASLKKPRVSVVYRQGLLNKNDVCVKKREEKAPSFVSVVNASADLFHSLSHDDSR